MRCTFWQKKKGFHLLLALILLHQYFRDTFQVFHSFYFFALHHAERFLIIVVHWWFLIPYVYTSCISFTSKAFFVSVPVLSIQTTFVFAIASIAESFWTIS